MSTVYLLWADPTDPYEPKWLVDVFASEDAAKAFESDHFPVHPWGKRQENGTLRAKARGKLACEDLIIEPWPVRA